MGDYCSASITVASRHVKDFEKLDWTLAWREDPTRSVIVTMEQEQANYGGQLPSNLPYVGSHGAGDDYPAMLFACDGVTSIDIVDFDGKPALSLKEDGEIEGIEAAKAYWQLHARAMAKMEKRRIPKPRKPKATVAATTAKLIAKAFTTEDWEELDSLGFAKGAIDTRDDVAAAKAAVTEKLRRLRSGFYGSDRTVKDWIEHMREIRDKLNDILL